MGQSDLASWKLQPDLPKFWWLARPKLVIPSLPRDSDDICRRGSLDNIC